MEVKGEARPVGFPQRSGGLSFCVPFAGRGLALCWVKIQLEWVCMGRIREPLQVLAIVAVISRHDGVVSWTKERLAGMGGEVALESRRFEHGETGFYEREMGAGLYKQFLLFEQWIDQAELADWKVLTNRLEEEFAATGKFEEKRPLNLDPGYLSEAKLVLATTKDRDHRIYLRDGIYAEVTLHYVKNEWQGARWTYPDYQRADYHAFFSECRDYFRKRKMLAGNETG